MMATSKRYSLLIPCMNEIKTKLRIVKINPAIDVHLMVFLLRLSLENAGTIATNENIININPISSNTINIPCGLNCVKMEIPSVSPANKLG